MFHRLWQRRRYGWMLVALAVPLFAMVAPPMEGLSQPGQIALGIFAMAAILWVSGALPLAVTGLMILASLPFFGALDSQRAYALFGNPAVFFILGALVLAAALMTTGLSRRVSLFLLWRFGGSARQLAFGILVSCALLSWCMPEHAVAAIVFPTVATITQALELQPRSSRLAILLYLSMAWGCITGGIATLLGGARAALAIGILTETSGQTLSFTDYSLAAAPISLVLTLVAGVLLQLRFKPEIKDVSAARERLREQVREAGRWSKNEVRAAVIAALAITSWILFGHSVGLATLALLCASALFAVNVVTWAEVEQSVNWGVFLLYGGAIALGTSLTETGATQWVAEAVPSVLPASPTLALVAFGAIAFVLTEFISNAATVAVLLPLALSVSPAYGLDPRLVTVAIAVPAGLAFTLPVGTPPSTIAFSSGYYDVPTVLVPGLVMTLCSLVVFAIACSLLWPLLPW